MKNNRAREPEESTDTQPYRINVLNTAYLQTAERLTPETNNQVLTALNPTQVNHQIHKYINQTQKP